MPENSEQSNPNPNPIENSNLFGVSMRAWLSFLIIGTVCLISIFSAYTDYKSGETVSVRDPLYSMGLIALGYFFGQKTTNQTIESKV